MNTLFVFEIQDALYGHQVCLVVAESEVYARSYATGVVTGAWRLAVTFPTPAAPGMTLLTSQ